MIIIISSITLSLNPKQEPQVLTGKGGLIVLDQSEDLPGTQRFCNQFYFFFSSCLPLSLQQ